MVVPSMGERSSSSALRLDGRGAGIAFVAFEPGHQGQFRLHVDGAVMVLCELVETFS